MFNVVGRLLGAQRDRRDGRGMTRRRDPRVPRPSPRSGDGRRRGASEARDACQGWVGRARFGSAHVITSLNRAEESAPSPQPSPTPAAVSAADAKNDRAQGVLTVSQAGQEASPRPAGARCRMSSGRWASLPDRSRGGAVVASNPVTRWRSAVRPRGHRCKATPRTFHVKHVGSGGRSQQAIWRCARVVQFSDANGPTDGPQASVFR